MKTSPRMLFINPSLRPNAKRKYPPVGLACIMTALKKAGYGFDFIDMDADCLDFNDVKTILKQKNIHYDLVGFGAIVSSLSLIYQLACLVRELMPDSLIIAGNSVATSIPDMLLQRTEVDVACIGEGDVTIVELADALASKNDWRTVPGIAYMDSTLPGSSVGEIKYTKKRNVVKNLDDLGFPDWNIFSIEKYNYNLLDLTFSNEKNQVIFPLNSARGCPFNCTFCYHCFKGDGYRSYSEDAIIDEIKRLKYEFGATLLKLWDELSFPTVEKFQSRIARMAELPFTIEWEGVTRANLFSANDLPLLQQAYELGCRAISFSIENASPVILKAMNKKITHDKTVDHALTLHKSGIAPLTSIIFGYPQETPETIKMTLDLCERCAIYPSVGFLLPLPGTPVYNNAVASGKIKDEWDYLMHSGDRQDFHINLTNMPTDELISCVEDGLRELATKLGVKVDNPLKTGVYQAVKKD